MNRTGWKSSPTTAHPMLFSQKFQLILICTAFLASSCGGTGEAVSNPATAEAVPASVPVSKSSNPTVRFLEDRVKKDPDDFIALNKLAVEYLNVVRETGDVAYLDLASRAAKASLAAMPAEQNRGGLGVLANVQYSSHDFAGARDNALRLMELDPGKGYVYQMLGDAQLELGQYDEAKAAFEKMRELGGIQTITRSAMEQRLARLSLLHGDLAKATAHFQESLKLARSMPDPPKETIAWCQWQIGEVDFAQGKYEAAEKSFRDSLVTYPDYFRALSALGRARAARGDLAGAIEYYEKAVKIIPDPYFVATLGDLYKLSGRDEEAARQYALVEQIAKLTVLSGTLYNRQLAMFFADHDLKANEAYDLAAKEFEARRDIYGADALAWTALKAGKLEEARAAIKDAMRLGTRDARLFYHAGMIAKAAGDAGEAKNYLAQALKLNPAFDPLQAPLANKALEELK
jgi:tetratricopeptide (TPR) repeat protein